MSHPYLSTHECLVLHEIIAPETEIVDPLLIPPHLPAYTLADSKLLLFQGAHRTNNSDRAVQVTDREWAEVIYYVALEAVKRGQDIQDVVSRMGTLAGIDAVTRLSLETDHA